MSPAARRTHLESLLRERNLDRTLTTVLPEKMGEDAVAPTGIVVVDARLGGGIPRGQISEVSGPRSSGLTRLLLAALAAATARGEIGALVDPLDTFDPESGAAAGIELSRLLWIRGQAISSARLSLAQERGGFHAAIDRALKALNLVLQAGHFGIVALDMVDVPPQVIGRIPFTTWIRVQRMIEGIETVCLLLGSDSIARSSAGLSIRTDGHDLHVVRARWSG